MRRSQSNELIEGAFLSSVERSLSVLECLAVEGGETLSDLARRLAINKNIAFRLVYTLEQLGYIYEDPETRQLMLTSKLPNLARAPGLQSDGLNEAKVIVKELAAETGELIRLAVVNETKLTWIFAETGSRRVLQINPAYAGDVIPHVHAASKAYLMTLSASALNEQISHMSFQAFTPHTITNAKALRAVLQKARQDGFAMSFDERDLGIAAVAAPVMQSVFGKGQPARSQCAGVVSLSIPSLRTSPKALAALAQTSVVKAAKRLSSFWPAIIR